jgi:ATP-dependent DNA helicase RecG
MRRLDMCEERGSGIDKVVQECEAHKLPAPRFEAAEQFTRVVLYSAKSFGEMDRQDKVRACYQHGCLKQVSGESLTNQSLRERLGIAESNYPSASRIITDAIAANLIKPADPTSKSKKHARYLPYWA